jgi:hypothetical protein
MSQQESSTASSTQQDTDNVSISCEEIANSTCDRVVYTTVKDFHDIFYKISAKYSTHDPERAAELSFRIYKRLSGKEIKFRKPVAQSNKSLVDQKKKLIPFDKKRSTQEYTWIKYEGGLRYTKDIYLTGGYHPLCLSDSYTVVAAIGDDDGRQLTVQEKKILRSKGFSIGDYPS